MGKILIGLTGSISLYKSINVIRSLEKRGHEVNVILTPSAEKFLSKNLISALTRGKVFTDVDFWSSGRSLHIELARWADVIAVVPCTANTLSKIRHLIADNLLTNTIVAYKGPILIAPAMHEEMWLNPELQEIVGYLKKYRGVFFSGPGRGPLASGETGCGRLYEEDFIVEDILSILKGRPLEGISIVVCYGRTEEPIDPVRVITNKSSGIMGYHLCRKVVEYGGKLVQVVGETSIQPYGRGEIYKVKTADEMFERIKTLLPESKVLIMAAAVSDYKPEHIMDFKLKKQNGLNLKLVKTVDILSGLSSVKKSDQIFVGFALETGNLIEYAKQKLKEKNLDVIVGNYAGAMGSEISSGVIIDRHGNETPFENVSKEKLAELILDKVLNFIYEGF